MPRAVRVVFPCGVGGVCGVVASYLFFRSGPRPAPLFWWGLGVVCDCLYRLIVSVMMCRLDVCR